MTPFLFPCVSSVFPSSASPCPCPPSLLLCMCVCAVDVASSLSLGCLAAICQHTCHLSTHPNTQYLKLRFSIHTQPGQQPILVPSAPWLPELGSLSLSPWGFFLPSNHCFLVPQDLSLLACRPARGSARPVHRSAHHSKTCSSPPPASSITHASVFPASSSANIPHSAPASLWLPQAPPASTAIHHLPLYLHSLIHHSFRSLLQ